MKKTKTKNKRDAADYTDIMKRIKPVGALPLKPTIVAYGRSGTGKTTFAASAPMPALLLNLKEDGTDSVMNVKGLKTVRIESWDELEQVYWYLKSGKHEFKTLIIDAVTEMQDLAIAKFRDDQRMSDDDMLSKRTWGFVSGLMKTWLFNFRDLKEEKGTTLDTVVFLAHDRTTSVDEDSDDENQLMPEVGPRLMPSVASFLCGMVNVIGYTYVREVIGKKEPGKKKPETKTEYRMRLAPHAYYTAKVRKPKEFYVPQSIVNPTYDKIVSIIRGEYQPKLTSTKKRGK
jgi:hypothetical protein